MSYRIAYPKEISQQCTTRRSSWGSSTLDSDHQRLLDAAWWRVANPLIRPLTHASTSPDGDRQSTICSQYTSDGTSLDFCDTEQPNFSMLTKLSEQYIFNGKI